MAEKNYPIKVFYSIFFTLPRWADAAFVWYRPARDAWSACKTAHVGTTRPTQRSKWLRRYSFLTCAVVQPLVLRPQTALGSGFSLQAAFWHQNAMLALFLRSKKSLKRSLSLLSPFRTPHKILSFYTLDSVVAILVAMEI